MLAARRECRIEKPGVVLLQFKAPWSRKQFRGCLSPWLGDVAGSNAAYQPLCWLCRVTPLGKADWRALWVSSHLPLTSRPVADRAKQVLNRPGARQ